MRRVVITGLGIVSCLGNNQDEVHQSLLNSKSGITFSEEYKEHNLKSHVHGKPNIKLEDHVDRKTIRFMGSGSAYNYIAMKEAIKDSGLEEKEVSNFKTGIVMGSGGPSIENVILAADKTRAKTPKFRPGGRNYSINLSKKRGGTSPDWNSEKNYELPCK